MVIHTHDTRRSMRVVFLVGRQLGLQKNVKANKEKQKHHESGYEIDQTWWIFDWWKDRSWEEKKAGLQGYMIK